MKLIIGNQNYSSWSMRPWLFLRFHELDIEIEKVWFFTPQYYETLGRYFSNGKVPLLIDRGFEVWDTLAILEYLNEQYPCTKGLPEDIKARSVARSVSAEMHSSFTAIRAELPMNCGKYFPEYKPSDAAMLEIDRIQQIWRTCRQNYGAEGAWLFGEFSIADAMYAPVAMRFRSLQLDLDEISKSYCQTVCENSAVQQWLNEAAAENVIVQQDELDQQSIKITPEFNPFIG